VQDEGSQLIGYALSPGPGEKVLDACAGAGGKTLHIADLTNGRASILATDMDFIRLRELGKRAYRAGIDSIKTQLIKSGKPIDIKNIGDNGLYDSVLVDAPCSGIGTVRRMPMQKYRLNEALLEKHAKKQLEILNNYSQLVKDGGILVYSTCSLMPEENSGVVGKFLSLHPEFCADPLEPVFSEHGIKLMGLSENSNTLTLFPHIHGTDGFFMARLIKSSV
jgi:16S rRNA (cytosine967-C5)-methyltransferase